jgi:hypothetical protein
MSSIIGFTMNLSTLMDGPERSTLRSTDGLPIEPAPEINGYHRFAANS